MIKRWIKRWLTSNEAKLTDQYSSQLPRKNCLSFVVHQANNGMVLEIETWDEQSLQLHTNLHLITPDQNLGAEINQIVLIHNLKR
jgi:hypothetical protein